MISALTDNSRLLALALARHGSMRLGTTSLFLLALALVLTVFHPLALTLASGDGVTNQKERFELARLSEHVSVRPAGRGNPTINLSDGHQLLTSYLGPEEMRVALEQNLAEPLSLASADFDEDGVPDLISGYSYNGQGIVTLLRGNVDSIYPNAPEAKQRKADGTFTEAPFLSPARVVEAPVAADFIGAGDFDGDSHWDVVAASRTRGSLFLLSGDGHGGFAAAQEIVLPGLVTAMTTGEINRADGLTDVVVGIATARGAEALVFEGPNGALKAQPEALPMPGRVTSLALGQLDGSYEMDLAVAAGEQLELIHGRDRKLSLDNAQQEKVLPAQIEGRAIGAPINALTIGDFTAIHTNALALLTANGEVSVLNPAWQDLAKQPSSVRFGAWSKHTVASDIRPQATQLVRVKVSSSPGDDLLVMDAGAQQLQLLTRVMSDSTTQATLVTNTASAALLPMRLNGDALTDLVALQKGQGSPSVLHTEASQTFTVNTTSDSDDGVCDAAHCSLREAINAANNNQGADTIAFNIPGAGPQIINLTSLLSGVTEAVTIDGTTQPGFAGTPLIELNGASAGAGVDGLVITGGNSTVRSLVINRFGGSGIHGRGIDLRGNSNVIEGNFIGTDATGTVDLGNGDDGVGVIGSSDNLIGGTTGAARNVLSGNGDDGVDIFTPGTPPIATGNLVQGNFIGTDVTGTVALGNDARGVNLTAQAPGCTIGGTTAGARNIMSGNKKSGIAISGPSDGTVPPTAPGSLVQGNFIGTDVTGTKALANKDDGLQIGDAPNNTIGGTTTAARNVISGNDNTVFSGTGVIVQGSATGNQIQGNFLGTDASGTKALPNSIHGASIDGPGNVLGGAVAGARNIISGNRSGAVRIGTFNRSASGNIVQGNFLGTDVSGTIALGNGGHGILIFETSNNIIGGLTPETRNVISNNAGNGILLQRADQNTVQGNYVGTDATGTAAMRNASPGVFIFNSNRNTIGGDAVGARNIISGNNNAGIGLYGGPTDDPGPQGSVENKIQGNFIGTDAAGMARLGNTGDGIQITIVNSGANNTVGGPQPGMRNIISGNSGNGIAIGIHIAAPLGADGKPLTTPGTGGTGITVQNNYIGTDVSGQNCIGNTLDGIFVDADSAINTISDNLIACNGRNGVNIPQNSNPAFKITITSNKIFANGLTAIDLGNPGDTANDDLDTDGGANTQQNYPEMQTAATSNAPKSGESINPQAAGFVTVNYRMHSSRNSTFNVEFFGSNGNCQNKQFSSSGERIGSETVTTDANGIVNRNITLTLPATVSAPQSVLATATATNVPVGTIGASPGNTSEMSQCLSVSAATWQPVALTAQQIAQIKAWTVGGRTYVYVKPQFPDAGYRVVDWGQVIRTGSDFTVDASVEKFTGPSVQSVVTTAQIYDLGPLPNATYNFNFKTSGTLATTLQFTVSSAIPPPNTIDTAREFVRQQYRDFLNREADQAGEDFWTDNITLCSNPARRPPGQTEAQCTLRQRETTSGAFFQSPEFQYTGYFVYRMYQGALGRQPKLSEFTPDAQFVGNGIVVNGQLSAAKINQNKTDFATQFVNCSDATRSRCAEFKAIYDRLNNQQYVDKLFQTTGVTPTASERDALVNGLNASQPTETRASVLQKVLDGIFVISEGNQRFDTTYGQAFYIAELNRAFVLLEYFGYMKRDPDDAGYAFWLGKLNQFSGNFVNAEMVLAFISSPEYRARFGQP